MDAKECIIKSVKIGKPLFIRPYREPKVWGAVDGIGEFWYGAEKGPKSSVAVVEDDEAPFREIVEDAPEAVLGKEVVRKFGVTMPLVKILTPRGRLSAQFHEAKNELWVVTGVDPSMSGGSPGIILGFSRKAVDKYGGKVAVEYGKALSEYGGRLNALIDILEEKGFKAVLEEKLDVIKAAETAAPDLPEIAAALDALKQARDSMEWFYNYRGVKAGDVIPVPSRTLHALGPGIEVVEPQIAGTTQSTEDGATYPVRYYFPGYEREGASKRLDVERAGEMRPEVTKEEEPVVVEEHPGVSIEKLPGDFADKGLEVYRINMGKGIELERSVSGSFHDLVSVKGRAEIVVGDSVYEIPAAVPGGEMLVLPASAGTYGIKANEDTQIIDTFTPV